MNKSLTVVLPVYNAERRLEQNVVEVLELASELTAEFGVLVVDDGSTDATFEVASELAARYPQVSVRRHRHRRGLGAALDYAQRRVRSDAVIVHDGVTPLDANQVRTLWRNWAGRSLRHDQGVERPTVALELTGLAAIHQAAERAHGRVLGFQLLGGRPHGGLPEEAASTCAGARNGERRPVSGVGQIPRLPRPKFLSAVAEFAWGE